MRRSWEGIYHQGFAVLNNEWWIICTRETLQYWSRSREIYPGPIVESISLYLSRMLVMFLEWRWTLWDNPVRVIKKFIPEIGVVVSSRNINIRFCCTTKLLPLGPRLDMANNNPQVYGWWLTWAWWSETRPKVRKLGCTLWLLWYQFW